MKSGKAHDVPLSTEAMRLLERLPVSTDSPFVFPGLKSGQPINTNSMRLFLRKKIPQLSVTVHGFRSTFRDWAEEQNRWGGRSIEACLAHTNTNKSESAYLRSDLVGQRRVILESWAQMLA